MHQPTLDRLYWRPEVEEMIGSPEMEALQLELLKRRVDELYHRTEYWRHWMDSHGARPEQLGSLADWAKMLPPFSKADFRAAAERYEADLERLIAAMMGAPFTDVRLLAATSGTTGEPTPYPLTDVDLRDCLGEVWARVFWRAGLRPHDRVLHAFALGMFIAGVPMVLSNMQLGACVIPAGAESGAERVLTIGKRFGATAMVATPSLAEHLIERAPEVLGAGVDTLGIDLLACGGEPGAGIPEVRSRLEQAYGASVIDVGAGFGGSCTHAEYQGMHWVADDLAMYELFDPDTGAPVPLTDGATGEACFTTFVGQGMTWVRQTGGDLHEVRTAPCPCGATGIRYRVIGRTDDMLKVKGVVVYPSAIAGVIGGLGDQVTGAFRIVLDEPPPRVVPPLKLKVERAEGADESGDDLLAAEIADATHQRLRVTPSVTVVDAGSLGRDAHKTDLFERTYT